MKKLIYGILVFTTFALTGIAFAAPTSTIVQNLFINGQKDSGNPCLRINSVGFVSTTTCGGGSATTTINGFQNGSFTLQGTAGQVLISNSNGTSTFSLPQTIYTTSSVTFAQVTMSTGTSALDTSLYLQGGTGSIYADGVGDDGQNVGGNISVLGGFPGGGVYITGQDAFSTFGMGGVGVIRGPGSVTIKAGDSIPNSGIAAIYLNSSTTLSKGLTLSGYGTTGYLTVGAGGLIGTSSAQSILSFPLAPASTTQFWTLLGLNLYPTSTTYSVGIGTTTPQEILSVVGHIGSYNGITPTMGACGSSPSVTGTDNAGVITTGGGVVTSCALNFGLQYKNPPSCVSLTNSTAITEGINSITTSTITFGFSASLSGGIVYYHCIAI